jgi:hypothetical protein
MAKQFILSLIILIEFLGCEKIKTKEDVKTEAEAFKRDLINTKNIGPTFLRLFGVKDKSELNNLEVSEPIPVLCFNSEKLNINFNNEKNFSYYLVPYTIKSKIVSMAFFCIREIGSKKPGGIIPFDCGTILKEDRNYAYITGYSSPIPIGVNPIFIYTDFSEFEVEVYKHNNELFGFSRKNSFVSEKGYQLIKNQGYTLKTIQEILEKNMGQKTESEYQNN